jgi:hypothetical protein
MSFVEKRALDRLLVYLERPVLTLAQKTTQMDSCGDCGSLVMIVPEVVALSGLDLETVWEEDLRTRKTTCGMATSGVATR